MATPKNAPYKKLQRHYEMWCKTRGRYAWYSVNGPAKRIIDRKGATHYMRLSDFRKQGLPR